MRTFILVQNLRCGGCAKTITEKLSTLPDISEVEVDIDHAKVLFHSTTDEGALLVKSTLKTLGYPSVDDKNSILAKGKSIVSCASGKLS